MNLTLGFPDFSDETALARPERLEGLLEQYRALMSRHESPVRAIRHQPAREGEFADIPQAVHRAVSPSAFQNGHSFHLSKDQHAFEALASFEHP